MGDWYVVYCKMTQYYLAFPSETYDTHICVFAESEDDAMSKVDGYGHTQTFKPQLAVLLNKKNEVSSPCYLLNNGYSYFW